MVPNMHNPLVSEALFEDEFTQTITICGPGEVRLNDK